MQHNETGRSWPADLSRGKVWLTDLERFEVFSQSIDDGRRERVI